MRLLDPFFGDSVVKDLSYKAKLLTSIADDQYY